MNSPTEETQQTMRQWQQWVASQPTAAEPSWEEMKVRLQAVHTQMNQRLIPPTTGLTAKLQTMATAWQTEWTRELRESAAWASRSTVFERVRTLLAESRLVDAVRAIENLLGECSLSARKILLADSVRQIGTATLQPTETQQTAGVDEFVRWLEQI